MFVNLFPPSLLYPFFTLSLPRFKYFFLGPQNIFRGRFRLLQLPHFGVMRSPCHELLMGASFDDFPSLHHLQLQDEKNHKLEKKNDLAGLKVTKQSCTHMYIYIHIYAWL